MTNQTPSASGPKSPRRELLEEAADLIDGDRDASYGSPAANFDTIAALWTARFAHKLKDGESFTAADYADAMILVKVGRNVTSQKRDTWADIAGYAGCGYEVSLEPEPEPKPEPKKFARGGVVTPKPDGPFIMNIHVDQGSDFNAAAIAKRVSAADQGLRDARRRSGL